MKFDFPHSVAPVPTALAESFAENAVEADLKQLFADLYRTQLADLSFDANVLGAAHLGSIDLVRKSVNTDGLVLMRGDGEEAAVRYLHRAWKAANTEGRGLHFLRTYLNLLFPGMCEVEQLWHDKDATYPTQLLRAKPRVNYWLWALGESGLKVNGAWKVGGQRPESELEAAASYVLDMSNAFLTSRIEISLDFAVQVDSLESLMHILRSVIPARMLPFFRFMLNFALFAQAQASVRQSMQKSIRLRHPWCGRVVGDSSDVVWKLGTNRRHTRLPSPFGFKLGRPVGEPVWRLNGCRTASAAMMQSHTAISAYQVARDGGQDAEAFGATAMSKSVSVDVHQEIITTQGYSIRMDYPFTAARLGARCKLSDWRRLDGRWGVGGLLTRRPFGFALRPDVPVRASAGVDVIIAASASANPESLMPDAPAVANRSLRIGSWRLGAPKAPCFDIKITPVH